MSRFSLCVMLLVLMAIFGVTIKRDFVFPLRFLYFNHVQVYFVSNVTGPYGDIWCYY